MSKGKQTFKQADLTRAIKAAQAAGLTVEACSIQEGRLVLAFSDGADRKPEIEEEGENTWADVE
jgi:hypothetical protein